MGRLRPRGRDREVRGGDRPQRRGHHLQQRGDDRQAARHRRRRLRPRPAEPGPHRRTPGRVRHLQAHGPEPDRREPVHPVDARGHQAEHHGRRRDLRRPACLGHLRPGGEHGRGAGREGLHRPLQRGRGGQGQLPPQAPDPDRLRLRHGRGSVRRLRRRGGLQGDHGQGRGQAHRVQARREDLLVGRRRADQPGPLRRGRGLHGLGYRRLAAQRRQPGHHLRRAGIRARWGGSTPSSCPPRASPTRPPTTGSTS